MRLPHAHRPEDDFWDPGDAPRFTLGEVIAQVPLAVLIVLIAIPILALVFLADVPIDPSPGWFQ